MILVNFELQCVECEFCGEQSEVRRHHFNDPHHMLVLCETLAVEHKDCERWKHDPHRAAAERLFKTGLRRELRRAAQKRAL